jgi:hypothetical protein
MQLSIWFFVFLFIVIVCILVPAVSETSNCDLSDVWIGE